MATEYTQPCPKKYIDENESRRSCTTPSRTGNSCGSISAGSSATDSSSHIEGPKTVDAQPETNTFLKILTTMMPSLIAARHYKHTNTAPNLNRQIQY